MARKALAVDDDVQAVKQIKPKQEPKTTGHYRTRSVWADLQIQINESKSVNPALRLVAQLLDTFKEAREIIDEFDPKTGQPVSTRWVVDPESKVRSLDINYMRCPVLLKFAETCIEENMQPTVYDFGKNQVLLTIEHVCTGGGHNDAETYDWHLIARPVTINRTI